MSLPYQITKQSLALGINAGGGVKNNSQGNNAIAIGNEAGQNSQQTNTVAIGNKAGKSNQGLLSIAIGNEAGFDNQNISCVALGEKAGKTNQGNNSIAIGKQAGETDQSANTIILNATGNTLNSDTSNATYIAPVRGTTSLEGSKLMFYDTTTKEVTYTNDGSIDLSCGLINDVSGINFCDGTFIGQGNSFDISTSEVLKVNHDALVVDTSKNIGIGTVQPSCSLDISRSDAIRLPTGTKSDRPHPAKKGMLRLLSETNEVIEFYDGVNWLPVQSIRPILNDVTPKLLNQYISNTLTLTGEFFPLETGSFNVKLIGQDNTEYFPETVSVISTTEATITIEENNQILNAGNNDPFDVQVINLKSNLTDTLTDIILLNIAPQITTNTGPSVSLGTFPVQAPHQDPNASFFVEGTDPDNSPPDASFVITSGDLLPGGFALQTSGDISGVFSVPNGSRTDATADTYNVTLKITDSSGGQSREKTFSFSLADPLINSITPSTITENTNTSINVTGDFFVVDSSSQFIYNISQVFSQSTSYVSQQELSLSNVNLGANPDGSPKKYNLQVSNGSVPVTLTEALTVNSEYIYATGGDTIDITVNGEQYRVHSFTTTGTHTFSVNNLAKQSQYNDLDILIIAGGGSGGASTEGGGGGGAGGMVEGTVTLLNNGNYTITVGDGGASVSVSKHGKNGNDSSAFSMTAEGGGGGGAENDTGNDGGSGGGEGDNGNSDGTVSQSTQTTSFSITSNDFTTNASGYGNNGGFAPEHGIGGAGGGGASQSGEGKLSTNSSLTGKGGDGRTSSITGTSILYAGGGGGGSRRANEEVAEFGGNGGSGGGGAGAGSSNNPGINGENGSPNTGGGGGGSDGSEDSSASSGAGGSGIVVIRYRITT